MDWKKDIDSSWTLFLDRDGVINVRIIDGYVRNIDEFHFLPGVLDAFRRFSEVFGRIIIVTNQQGEEKRHTHRNKHFGQFGKYSERIRDSKGNRCDNHRLDGRVRREDGPIMRHPYQCAKQMHPKDSRVTHHDRTYHLRNN